MHIVRNCVKQVSILRPMHLQTTTTWDSFSVLYVISLLLTTFVPAIAHLTHRMWIDSALYLCAYFRILRELYANLMFGAR